LVCGALYVLVNDPALTGVKRGDARGPDSARRLSREPRAVLSRLDRCDSTSAA